MRSIFRNALRRNARERCERALPYDRSKAKCAAFLGMPCDEMPESSANGRFLMDRRLGMETGDSGKKIYVGIDLDGDVAMVSFSYENGEPETVSPFTGSEIFSIPMAVCLKRDEGGWAYGEEARRIAKAGLGHCEERLFERACRGEQVQMGTKLYALSDLLAMFLKKMVTLAGRLGPKISLSQLVITTRTLDAGVIEMLREVAGAMQLTGAQVHFIDTSKVSFIMGARRLKMGRFTIWACLSTMQGSCSFGVWRAGSARVHSCFPYGRSATALRRSRRISFLRKSFRRPSANRSSL